MTETCIDEKIRRFDDVYRVLLVVAGVFFSYSLAFYRDRVGIRVFNFVLLFPLMSAACWCVARLRVLGKRGEGTSRVVSWYFLIFYVAVMTTDPVTYMLDIPHSHPYPFIFTWAVAILTALSVVFFTRYLGESIPLSQRRVLYLSALWVTCLLLYFSLRHFFPEFQLPPWTT